MILFIVILFAVCCFGMRFSSFHQDYSSLQTTTAIKGVFAILIVFPHLKGYITLDPGVFSDRSYNSILSFFGQLVVSVYFFYSGYGIFESVRRKKGYSKFFFRNRILRVLIHFDIAVFLFLIVQTILGNKFEPSNYLLCWCGWQSIGNSNWFIFDLLVVYLLTWGVLLIQEKRSSKPYEAAILISIACSIFYLMLRYAKGGQYWWYDTLLTFPAGMWFSCLQNTATFQRIMDKKWTRYLVIILSLLLFLGWRVHFGIDYLGICSIIFAFALTMGGVWVKIGNPVLAWCGKFCFPIYILQRLPMIVLSHLGINQNKIVFSGCVIACTLLLAWGFSYLTNAVDTKLIKKQ